MYIHNFIKELKVKHQKKPITILINHSLTDLKHLLTSEWPQYQYISLKQRKYLNLLKNDPYKFFNLYAEKVIIDHIDVYEELIATLFKYAMSAYNGANYLLVSTKDVSIPDKRITTLKLYPFENEVNESLTLTCSIQFKNQLKLHSFFHKLEQFIPMHNKKHLHLLVKLLAREIDQVLNVNKLAKELQASQPSVSQWISKLEQYGIIFLLPSFSQAYGKRVIKAPKIYFTHLGLACQLSHINSGEELLKSGRFFKLVHNKYVLELMKKNELDAHPKQQFYWKESNGHEIPFLFQNPTSLDIYAFTSSHEVLHKDWQELDYFDFLTEGAVLSKTVVCDAYQEKWKQQIRFLPWRKINAT